MVGSGAGEQMCLGLDGELAPRISLVRCEAIPVNPLLDVLGHTGTEVIHPREPGLRLWSASLGESGENPQREGVVLGLPRRGRQPNTCGYGRGGIDRSVPRG